MKHNHPFAIGERVWDDDRHEWAIVFMFGVGEEEGSNFLVLKNDRGELWEALYEDVYQIAEGLRTANSGDIVCYDGHPRSVRGFLRRAHRWTRGDWQLLPFLYCPVFVEDENGRLENIVHIWYDSTRHMIRLTVGGVEFQDSEE